MAFLVLPGNFCVKNVAEGTGVELETLGRSPGVSIQLSATREFSSAAICREVLRTLTLSCRGLRGRDHYRPEWSEVWGGGVLSGI